MKRLLVITCSATKREDPGLLPALDRYDGPVYRVLRAHHRRGHRLPRTMILSAWFGLIESSRPIRVYDQSMTSDCKEMWKICRDRGVDFQNALDRVDEHLIVAGKDYLEVLESWSGGRTLNIAPGGIGRKLGQLKRWLEA